MFLPQSPVNSYRGGWAAEGVVEGRLAVANGVKPREVRVDLSPRIGFARVQVDDRVMVLE